MPRPNVSCGGRNEAGQGNGYDKIRHGCLDLEGQPQNFRLG